MEILISEKQREELIVVDEIENLTDFVTKLRDLIISVM